MPGSHRMLLTLALFLAGAGGVGQISTILSQGNSASPTVQTSDQTSAGSRGFVSDQSAPAASAPEESPTLVQKWSPAATRVGFSFIVGFVVGWVFRAFLKLTSAIAAAGMAIMGALTYFRIINIDMSSAQQQYDSAMHWLTDQSWRAAQAIIAHIPGSASSFAGMFIGFRRKR
jgi:uncharacterized membrane protein (Fun14 family)